jgi:alcohol dehydrogenase class IV
VDPALTASASPQLTAATGMDALAQAIESYWSIHSTGESKTCARRAIELVLRCLPDAVRTGSSSARRGMSKAAHLAGRAINITKTTGAHALSYPLTSYFGIPHGHAVALTLGQWLLFNSEVTEQDVRDPRGAGHVRAAVADLLDLLDCEAGDEGCRRIGSLCREIGLQTSLGELGVSRAQALEVVVPNVNAERLVNNPRAVTPDALRRIVEAVC